MTVTLTRGVPALGATEATEDTEYTLASQDTGATRAAATEYTGASSEAFEVTGARVGVLLL